MEVAGWRAFVEVVAIVKSCFFFLFQNSKAKPELRKPDVVAVYL